MYFVYILRSLPDRKTYVGRTEKLPVRRLYEHNLGSNKWTSRHKPFELIYFESYICKEDAIRREKYLKSGIGNKLVVLIRDNFNKVYVAQFRPPGDRPVGGVRASH